jgi:hypothetical protein
MTEFKSHSGLKVGETKLMLVRKVSPGVCVYAPADGGVGEIIEGCNGPLALARELRRVTPDRCVDAAVRVTELCQEAAGQIASASERGEAAANKVDP